SPVRMKMDWDHLQITETFVELEILSETDFKLVQPESGLMDFNTASAAGDDSVYGKTDTFGEEIETPRSKFSVSLTNPSPIVYIVIFRFLNPTVLEEDLAKSVQVAMENEYSSVLTLTTKTKVVEKGRDYINALMQSYIEYDLNEKNKIQENTIDFIE